MKRRLHFARSEAGFSLIEVMAVMAIVLLLFVLYWGPTTGNSHQRQLQKECQNQLQRLYMSLTIYANEYAGAFPVVTNARTSAEALAPLVPRYTVDASLFLCPGLKSPPVQGDKPFGQQRISYAYYMGRHAADQGALMSDEQVNPSSKNPGEAAFSSTGKAPGNNHGKLGGNFLFCDGRAESAPPRVPFSLGLTQGLRLLNP
jgi:prepilin-type N-terminal cleavage/methylation domain-containing protein/prepilin-type processing-associated H-X9-DG protein